MCPHLLVRPRLIGAGRDREKAADIDEVIAAFGKVIEPEPTLNQRQKRTGWLVYSAAETNEPLNRGRADGML
ncbi:MAG: hypothetical protein ACYS0H_30395 [Planctomycetota bacterium]